MRITKTTCVILVLLLISNSIFSQSDNPKYNKHLADSLGADEYGMKMYMLVILKTGTVVMNDSVKRADLFKGHMENIGRLANEGKLVIAGPLQKNDKNYRGIFVLNVKTIEEARKLLATDPTIEAKLLDADIFGWYGSAALPLYLPSVKAVEKKQF